MTIAQPDVYIAPEGVSADLFSPQGLEHPGTSESASDPGPLHSIGAPCADSAVRREVRADPRDFVAAARHPRFAYPRLGPNMAKRLSRYLLRQGQRDLNDEGLTVVPDLPSLRKRLWDLAVSPDARGRPRRLRVDFKRPLDGLTRHEMSNADLQKVVWSVARTIHESWRPDYRAEQAERGRAGGARTAMLHQRRPARRVANLDDLLALPPGLSKREQAVLLDCSTATVGRLRAAKRCIDLLPRDPISHRIALLDDASHL